MGAFFSTFLRSIVAKARSGFADLAVIAVFILVSAIVAIPITYVANQTNTDNRNKACDWICTPSCGCGCRDYFDNGRQHCYEGGGGSNPSNPTNPNPSAQCSGAGTQTASACYDRAVGSLCAGGFPGTCVKNGTAPDGKSLCGCKPNATAAPTKPMMPNCSAICYNNAGCTCPATCNSLSITPGSNCGGTKPTNPTNPTTCDASFCMPSAECGSLGGTNTGKTCSGSSICCSKKESSGTPTKPLCPDSANRCMSSASCARIGGSVTTTYTCGSSSATICCSKVAPKATPRPTCPDSTRCMSSATCAGIGGSPTTTYACQTTTDVCCSKTAPKTTSTPKPTPKSLSCDAASCDADLCLCPTTCKYSGLVDRSVSNPCGGRLPPAIPPASPVPISCDAALCSHTAGCICSILCASSGFKSYNTARPCGEKICIRDGEAVGPLGVCCSNRAYMSGNTLRCGNPPPNIGCVFNGKSLQIAETTCRSYGDDAQYTCSSPGDGDTADDNGTMNLSRSACPNGWTCRGDVCSPVPVPTTSPTPLRIECSRIADASICNLNRSIGCSWNESTKTCVQSTTTPNIPPEYCARFPSWLKPGDCM